MKLTSIGFLAATGNLLFGFANTINVNDAFWSTLGAIALVTAGILIGMSVMERFTRS